MIEVRGLPFLSKPKEGTGGSFLPASDLAILGTMPFMLSSIVTSHPATITRSGVADFRSYALVTSLVSYVISQ